MHVDDLTVLIKRLVDVTPPARDLHIRSYPRTNGCRPRGGTVGPRRRGAAETLNPPEQCDVIDFNSAVSQQLLEVALREPVARRRFRHPHGRAASVRSGVGFEVAGRGLLAEGEELLSRGDEDASVAC
jgi:hypothetical protein